MTLDEATELIRTWLGLVDTISTETVDYEVCTGGHRKKPTKATPPALFTHRSDAVDDWLRRVVTFAADRPILKLADGPHLDRWEVSVLETTGAHRVVEPRFSVTATFAVPAEPAETN